MLGEERLLRTRHGFLFDMAKDPAVLFYTSDFLSGVIDLDMAERGQYITLLCAQHQKGHLSEKTIRLLVGSVSVSVLQKFKQDEDGLYFNERMEMEANKRKQFIESRQVNGKKGGRPKNHMDNLMDNHKANLMENENENDNENDNINYRGIGGMGEKGNEVYVAEPFPTFNDAWEAYQHKVGRKAAETAWKRLKQHERESAYTKIPLYVQSLSDRKFQAHLSTWLNGRRWEDEYSPIKKPLSRTFRDEQDLAAFLAVRPDN